MRTPQEAVLQVVGAGPQEVVQEGRTALEDCDSRPRRQQTRRRREQVHSQEKSSGVAILAVDIVPCPMHPAESLVDDPTGPLEYNRATASPRFAMPLHFARSCHIPHNRLHPRE
jgi:hypothetical protein